MRNYRPLILLLILLLPACTTTHFLGQAARGHFHVQHTAIPIDRLLTQNTLDPHTHQLLACISALKTYAQDHALLATDQYERYTSIDGDSVVWVVIASPPLTLQPRTWTFPLIGSFTYLGWFHEKAAQRHATKLRHKGLEVHVQGAQAYSTLGYFRDPILSTMITPGPLAESSLAHTVFHESVHATVFVKDQSYFNESVAQWIAGKMTHQYLKDTFGEHAPETEAYQVRTERSLAYAQYVNKAGDDLETLYRSSLSDDEKLGQKQVILDTLQQTLTLNTSPNNATLIAYRTYNSATPVFATLFDAYDQDWSRFIAHLNQLRPHDFQHPHQKDFHALLHPKKLAHTAY